MSKYGFDYFLSRTPVLVEMARPTKAYLGVSPEFNTLYDTLMKRQGAQGVKDTATRNIIVWRFIVSTLNDISHRYEDEDGLMDSKQILKTFRKIASQADTRLAFAEFVNDPINKGILNSKEFSDVAYNDENMQRFKRDAGFLENASEVETDENGNTVQRSKMTSNRRTGADRMSTEHTGRGIVGNEKLRSHFQSILTAMNKEMFKRRQQFKKNGVTATVTDNPEDSPNQSYSNSILAALEELQYDKTDITNRLKSGKITQYDLDDDNEILAKVPMAIVDALKTQYSAIHDAGGISPEEFEDKLLKLKSKKGVTPTISNFLLLLKDTVDTFSSASSEPSFADDGQELFGGYDPDLFAKYVPDSNDEKKLKNFLAGENSIRAAKLERLEQLYTSKILNLAIQSNQKFADIKQDDVHINPAIQQYMAEIQKLENMLDKTTDQGTADNLEAKIDAIKKQIAFARSGNQAQDQDQEEEEHQVMGYMTEQVKKDKHHNSRGVLVERNFKKFKNTFDWMEFNSNL